MDRPELLASYCPGCGCSPARAPCQKCGTPAPDQVDPSPADGSVYGLLGLGVFSLGVAAYLLLTLEGVAGWVGGGFLTLVGTALIAMFAWNRIADEREWTLVADGARATVVLGRLGVVFATGWREERGPLEVDVADLASCSAGDLWAALEQRLHPIETLETALPELMALAAAARGEVVVRRCSRVAWGLRSGRVVEQPVALEGLEVEGEPDWLDAAAKVLDDEPPAANPEGIELALAWLDGHPVWLEAWQPH